MVSIHGTDGATQLSTPSCVFSKGRVSLHIDCETELVLDLALWWFIWVLYSLMQTILVKYCSFSYNIAICQYWQKKTQATYIFCTFFRIFTWLIRIWWGLLVQYWGAASYIAWLVNLSCSGPPHLFGLSCNSLWGDYKQNVHNIIE